jgi:hypothetical protein
MGPYKKDVTYNKNAFNIESRNHKRRSIILLSTLGLG